MYLTPDGKAKFLFERGAHFDCAIRVVIFAEDEGEREISDILEFDISGDVVDYSHISQQVRAHAWSIPYDQYLVMNPQSVWVGVSNTRQFNDLLKQEIADIRGDSNFKWKK